MLIPLVVEIPKTSSTNRLYDPYSQVYHINIRNTTCPQIKVKVFETELEALLDSGAGISILNSLDIVNRYALRIQPASIRVTTADGSAYGCLGYVNVPYSFKGVTKVVPTLVVPEISRHLILGADFWKTFGIKPMIDSGSRRSRHNSTWERITTVFYNRTVWRTTKIGKPGRR